MTPTPDTPTRTPEEILEALNGMIDSLDEHVTITDIAAQLLNLRDSIRDGLLVVAPTEEQIERSGLKLRIAHEIDEAGRYWFAYVYARDRATVDRLVALARSGVHHVAYANSYAEAAQLGVSMLDEIEAALTAAAGVAPQEPSEPTSMRRFHRAYPGMPELWHTQCSEHEEFGTCAKKEQAEADIASHLLAAHKAPPAPSLDREKLSAVRLYCENQGDKFRHHAGRILEMLDSSDALAAQPVLDPEKVDALRPALAAVPDETELAEVIDEAIEKWGDMYLTPQVADLVARVVREWWEKKR